MKSFPLNKNMILKFKENTRQIYWYETSEELQRLFNLKDK